MQQYFIDEKFDINSNYVLSKDDSNHIVRIMRKKVDDKIYVVFRDEVKYICNIIDNNIDGVVVEGFSEVVGTNELPVKLTVAIPPLKGDKVEYLIQKLTELGTSSIILFNSERNISKLKKDKVEAKLKRFEKIIKEAAEQSKRNIIPDITYVDSLKELVEATKKDDYKVVAYEKESVNADNINLKNLFSANLTNKSVVAVFGSEGGLSEKEIEILTTSEFSVVGLGRRILRAETAPLYFASTLGYFAEFGNNNEKGV